MSATKEDIIKKFNMLPHPEGGYYSETFRSDININCTMNGNDVTRQSSTAIYFLIDNANVSRLHRIQSDEIWHYYMGTSPLVVVELSHEELDNEEPTCKKILLGHDILNNQHLQYVVKRNTWFGCYPLNGWALVGCTVSPGFDFGDFELASQEFLLKEFPLAHNTIKKLTVDLP